MPFVFYNYCTYACRKQGAAPSFAPSCVNWWCYNDGNNGLGFISTQLIGNGHARLDYGICYGYSVGDSTSYKVTVYLNGNKISSVVGGNVLETSNVVDFYYRDSDTLMIEESGACVFQFNSFSVVECYPSKCLCIIIPNSILYIVTNVRNSASIRLIGLSAYCI